MTKFIVTAAVASLAAFASTNTARADFFFWKKSSHHGHGHGHGGVSVSVGPSRSVYVIEGNRPVQRTVYVDGGRYYRVVSGRRVYVTNRVYTSYPSKYYYPDGRRRTVVHHHH